MWNWTALSNTFIFSSSRCTVRSTSLKWGGAIDWHLRLCVCIIGACMCITCHCYSWSFFNITCVMIKCASIVRMPSAFIWMFMYRHFQRIHFNYIEQWGLRLANVIILFVIITNLFVNKIIVKKRLKINWATACHIAASHADATWLTWLKHF